MNPSSQTYDIAVIGAGLAGLNAALQCAERGATVACIEQAPLGGGLIANVGRIDSFPTGGAQTGAALVDALGERCRQLEVRMLNAEVTALADAGRHRRLATSAGDILAQRVIVAAGARLRRLGVPGEAEFAGRGVSQCDWCDGGFFRNEPVVVVGGGDAAFQAALHLAQLCESVTVVMRGAIRARRSYVQQAGDNERIAFLWDTSVEAIEGTDKVQAVLLRDQAEGTTYRHATAGVFVFAGTEPNTAFLPPAVQLDAAQRVVTDAELRTSLAGVLAAGAVRAGYRGSAASACGEGATAAAVAMEELENAAA
jgi:thioredoxin reductase (NADPH)